MYLHFDLDSILQKTGVTCIIIIVNSLTDGQKIAIRLSRRITVVTKSLRKSLAEYNAGLDPSSCLTWEQVTDLSQQIHDECLFSESSIPSIVKSQAIQLYNSMFRAEEEISRLKEEMSNCTQYFIGIYNHLTGKIVLLKQNQENALDIGRISLLKQSLRKYRIIFASLLQFNKYIDISQLKNFLLSLDDDLEPPMFNSPVENEETVSIQLSQSLNDEFSDGSDHEEKDNEDSHDMYDLMESKNILCSYHICI